jgi:hypothetical protein
MLGLMALAATCQQHGGRPGRYFQRRRGFNLARRISHERGERDPASRKWHVRAVGREPLRVGTCGVEIPSDHRVVSPHDIGEVRTHIGDAPVMQVWLASGRRSQ